MEPGIKFVLSTMKAEEIDVIELSVNVDGLPIYKSRNISLWPIQCAVVNIKPSEPFVAALYSASHKPENCEFLEDCISELTKIMQTGIHLEGCDTAKRVLLRCFVCDAPARSLIKATVQYNGRYGCDFCEVRGQFDGRMLFLYKGSPRTDTSFRDQSNPEHHKGESVLTKLDIDMITQFPADPMHCIDLGVTRKLLLLWKEGPIPHKLSAGHISLISNFHCSIRPFLTAHFNRKPRGMDELKMWKATEFRTFLMYTGPVILKYILPTETYRLFMSLSVAVCIMYNAILQQRYAKYASHLLEYFIAKIPEIYDEKFITYNVHCLHHMADFAQKYGCLNNCTAYTFENNMSKIKKMIRGPGNTVVQVARRLDELQKNRQQPSSEPTSTLAFPKKGKCYRFKNRKTKKFCFIHEVHNASEEVLCEVYTREDCFYDKPCDSRLIGVYKVTTTHTEMERCSINQLDCEVIRIPLSLFDQDQATSAVIIPLFHYL